MVLHAGAVAEMSTGEGKTLVATLPAYLNALTGRRVHVVTVNDYLATRDAEWWVTPSKALEVASCQQHAAGPHQWTSVNLRRSTTDTPPVTKLKPNSLLALRPPSSRLIVSRVANCSIWLCVVYRMGKVLSFLGLTCSAVHSDMTATQYKVRLLHKPHPLAHCHHASLALHPCTLHNVQSAHLH